MLFVGAVLAREAYLAGAYRLRRYRHEDAEALRARVCDRVLDVGRDDDRVVRLEGVDLGTGPQPRLALEDDVERVRSAVVTRRLLLARLEADELTDEPGPVDEADAHRPLAQKTARLVKVEDFH